MQTNSPTSVIAKDLIPRFQKIDVDRNSSLPSPTSSGRDDVQKIMDCREVWEVGSLIKWQGRMFQSREALKALDKKIDELQQSLYSRDISVLLVVIANIKFDKGSTDVYRAILAKLAVLALKHIHGSTAKDVSMALHALSKHNISNKELFRKAAKHGLTIVDDLIPEGLSNMVIALSKMNAYSYEFFDRAARTAVATIGDFNAQSLCFMADAYARTKHHDPELSTAILQKALPFLDTFRPQELVTLIEAFANMGHPSEKLFERASTTILARINLFNDPCLLARIATSFARCGYKHREFWNAIAKTVIRSMDLFGARTLSQVLSAFFVQMDHFHPKLLRVAKAATISKMPTFDPTGIVVITQTFREIVKIDGSAVFSAAAQAAESILDDFHPDEIALLVGCFARTESFSGSSDSLFSKIASLLLSDPFEVSRWNSNNLVGLAEAFARGGLMNTKLVELIGTTIVARADMIPMDASKLQQLVTAFAGFETPPTSTLVWELLFRSFMEVDKSEIDLSLVIAVAKAIPFGQRKEILPDEIMKRILELSLEKGTESDIQEVFPIFSQFAQLGLNGRVMSHGKRSSDEMMLNSAIGDGVDKN